MKSATFSGQKYRRLLGEYVIIGRRNKNVCLKKNCHRLLLAALFPFLVSCSNNQESKHLKSRYWSTSWATSMKVATPGFDPPLPNIKNTTIRQTIKLSGGGEEIRVWFSNEFGNIPLKIDSATVSRNLGQELIETASLKRLLFKENEATVIPPGERIASDPLKFPVKNLSELVISIHLPDDLSRTNSPISYHVRGLQTNYLAPGKQVESANLKNAVTSVSYFFLAALDVKSQDKRPVIAAVGDSIMDGDQAADAEPVDENARFNNFLANIIFKNGRRANVLNLGISGNQVTQSFLGQKPLDRFDRDILSIAGLTHVIVLGGINDIGLPGLLNEMGIPAMEITAEKIISEHQKIIAKIKENGLVAIGGTLTPSGGFSAPSYGEEAADAKRQRINNWIRTSGSYDHVIDFDAVLRDPDQIKQIQPKLTADGLHPNTKGYKRMANAAYSVLSPYL